MNRLFKSIALTLAVVMTLNLAACAAPAAQPAETTAAATEAVQQETAAVEENKPAAETAAPAADEAAAPAEDSDNDLIILYTNDTHGHIDNYIKENEDGKKGLSFASTGGTEWDKSDHFERDSEYEKYFLKYWDPKENYHRCENDPGDQGSFIDLETKPRKHTMHMCWTTKPIERDMSGISNDKKPLAVEDIGKKCPICLPYKWGVDLLTKIFWDMNI